MARTSAQRTAASRLRRVLVRTVWAVVALVLLPLITGAAAVALDRARVLTVLSGSMSPALPVGSLLLDLPMDARDVEVGDILTFTRPDGQIVTHRVLTLSTSADGTIQARTGGDANNVADDWDVTLSGGPVWVVRHHVPGLGAALSPITSNPLLPLATVVLPLLLGMLWIRTLWTRDVGDVGAEDLTGADGGRSTIDLTDLRDLGPSELVAAGAPVELTRAGR